MMLLTATATRRSAPARAVVVAVGGAAVAAATVLAVGDPNRGGFPACPLHSLTGLNCPGCGTQRALHALAHGHLGVALHDNAFAILAIPVLLYAYVMWAGRAFSFAVPQLAVPSRWLRWLGPAVIAFTVARNLPFGHILAPLGG
jgi:hypothetical protein